MSTTQTAQERFGKTVDEQQFTENARNLDFTDKNLLQQILEMGREIYGRIHDTMMLEGTGTTISFSVFYDLLNGLDDHRTWEAAGHECLETADFEKAVMFFKMATKIGPDSATAWDALGLSLSGLGEVDCEEIMNAFRNAIRLNPKNIHTMHRLGNMLNHFENHEGALTIFTQAIAAKPDYAPSYVSYGLTLVHLGRSDEAKDVFKKALQIMPNNIEAMHYLLKLGEIDLSILEQQLVLLKGKLQKGLDAKKDIIKKELDKLDATDRDMDSVRVAEAEASKLEEEIKQIDIILEKRVQSDN